MKARKLVLFVGICCLFLASFALPANATILVLSPHPDDDILMASGVTYNAIAKGEQVIVVYVTNGDYYAGFQQGYLREGEAVIAQTRLNNGEDNLIFLGYPDGYISTIHNDYPGQADRFTTPDTGASATYGNRGLGRTDYHTYRFGQPASYNLYNMVLDLAQIITDYRPNHIITTSQADQHADHSGAYRLLALALQSAMPVMQGYSPTVHTTVIHWNDSVWPLAMNPTTYFTIPPSLAGETGRLWPDRESLDVPLCMQSTAYEQNPKYLAVADHVSQGGVSALPGRFIHKDEIFWIDTSLGGTNHAPSANAGVDQSVAQETVVTLDGSGSRDPDGGTIAYTWTQVSGPTVQLTNPATVNPTFVAPTTSGQAVLTFQLTVGDGQLSSLTDAVNVTVGPAATTTETNLAASATVTASSQNAGDGQTAVKAVDGTVDGYPGDYTREWATTGQGAGAWLRLTWGSSQMVNRLVLNDRPNGSDQILAGTVSFSDGTSIQVGPLENTGAATEYTLASPKSTTSLTLAINSVSSTTHNVGLAEIEVYGTSDGTATTNHAPAANAGPDQTLPQGAIVTLDGSASSDQDGNPITYAWTQVSGSAVQLSNAAAMRPTFTIPTGTQYEQLVFQLIVNDGNLNSAPDTVIITEQAPVSVCTNIASLAQVTASSQNAGDSQTAVKAADGTIDGYPGDYTREWATAGQGAGAWLRLAWPSQYTVDEITLCDRPNANDQIVSGTISFDDGTSIQVGPLDNAGAATSYSFGAKTISNLLFTVNQVAGSTHNIGLAEIVVCGTPAGGVNRAPIANAGSDQTVAQGVTVTLDGSASRDPDGNAITYMWSQVSGTTAQLSDATAVNPTFTAPSGSAQNEQLAFQLIVNDGHASSAADTVTITTQPQTTTVVNIAPLAQVTVSSDNPGDHQTAAKAVDGTIDGYPGDYTREWATRGERAGAWLRLTWSAPRTINKVVLYDRPNNNDQIVSGTIAFDDGTSISIGQLNNAGAGNEYTFADKTTTTVTLTINQVSGSTHNVGLSEIQVFGIQ